MMSYLERNVEVAGFLVLLGCRCLVIQIEEIYPSILFISLILGIILGVCLFVGREFFSRLGLLVGYH